MLHFSLSMQDLKTFILISALDDLLGFSSTSLDVDPSSVRGETELNAFVLGDQTCVLSNDTDPLMWWKQLQQEFPRLAHMTR